MSKLTPREIDTLHLIACGLTNQEICNKLVIAKSTVKKYIQNIFKYLNVDNRQSAVAEALRYGLIALQNDAVPNNLSASLTKFVGRQSELKLLDQFLLSNTDRLINILAPAGMGKSRLAIRAARGHVLQHKRFADGVFFVSLLTTLYDDQVLSTTSKVIGAHLTQNNRLKDSLINHLRDKRMLLIFDNFEHLVDYRQLITDILETSPNVKILITSRVKLNIQGEQILNLAGLKIASEFSQNNQTKIIPAVELFNSVAQRNGGFNPSAETKPATLQICKLVDGHPLALELAAAWTDTFSLSQILAKIKQNLSFLETDQHGVADRHRSILTALEGMWNVLSNEEQAVFAKLSVFRGPFTHEAAISMVGCSPVILRNLISKSLLQNMHDGWFQAHQLLRKFGQQKLIENQQFNLIIQPQGSQQLLQPLIEPISLQNNKQELKKVQEV